MEEQIDTDLYVPIAGGSNNGDIVGTWVRVIQRNILLDGQGQGIVLAIRWYRMLDDPEDIRHGRHTCAYVVLLQ